MAKVEQKGTLSKSDLREFFREMLLIRRFEEKVEERFRAGELPGFLHVAIGQEAAAVGVCSAMEDGDVFASTHRAHGHTLAGRTRMRSWPSCTGRWRAARTATAGRCTSTTSSAGTWARTPLSRAGF